MDGVNVGKDFVVDEEDVEIIKKVCPTNNENFPQTTIEGLKKKGPTPLNPNILDLANEDLDTKNLDPNNIDTIVSMVWLMNNLK